VGLDLPESAEALDDVEPMLPDWPAQRALAARLLPVLLAEAAPAPADGLKEPGVSESALVEAMEREGGPESARLWGLARAGNEYPAGALGETALAREFERLRAFARRQRQFLAEPAQPPHRARFECRIDGETWSLSASFADLRASGQLRARYDDTRASDYLGAWLAHLLLCSAPAPGVRCETRGLSRDGDFHFAPLDPTQARQQLETLLGLYREGLRAPLRFFPKSAWAYVKNSDNPRKAVEKWTGGMRTEFGEANDPAYRLALRGVDQPLGETFFTLASKVFAPLMQSLLDDRLP
jgi:exodeoxyribonuclease V gamma subunit